MEKRTEPSTTTDEPLAGTQAERAPVGRGAVATAGLSGLAYGLLLLVAAPPDGPPVVTATAQQIRDNVAAQGTAIQISAVTGMLGLAAAVVFVAALARQVRDRLPGSLLGDVVLAGGILVVVYQWLLITAEAMTSLLPKLIESDIARVDDATLRGWYGLTGFTHFLGDLAVVPMVVIMAAFSIAALRGGLLPKWLSWTGVVFSGSGVLGMVGVLVVVEALYAFWFAALFGYWLWVLALAVTFLLRLRRTRSSEAA